MKTGIELVGDKELRAALKNMPEAFSDRVIGQGYMRAAKPLIEKEKELAPKGKTKNLVKSIGAYRATKSSRQSIGEVRAGPRRKGGFKGFSGHLNEFGTKARRNKKGANRGRMPMHPFVAPAFRATKDQVLERFKPEMRQSFVRNMKRFLRQK